MNQRLSPWRVSIAPMMDWTDRHCRYFHRLLTKHTRLYTEMVTSGALLHGDVPRHLDFNEEEDPVALQLGGSEPQDLALCAKLAQRCGYDEVNLNCGCPSERVQRGAVGACLMVGREAYDNPWTMADWDARFFGAEPMPRDRNEVEARMIAYMERVVVAGIPWSRVVRHMLGLRNGLPGARHWRQAWSDHRLKTEAPALVAALASEHRAQTERVQSAP